MVPAALGSTVNTVLKITDGNFKWKKLSWAAVDAAGNLLPSPNLTIACKKGSYNIFSEQTSLSSLQRGDQPVFELPDPMDLIKGEELNFIVGTLANPTAVATLNLTLIGDEAK